jgi:hypothetical protein
MELGITYKVFKVLSCHPIIIQTKMELPEDGLVTILNWPVNGYKFSLVLQLEEYS